MCPYIHVDECIRMKIVCINDRGTYRIKIFGGVLAKMSSLIKVITVLGTNGIASVEASSFSQWSIIL